MIKEERFHLKWENIIRFLFSFSIQSKLGGCWKKIKCTCRLVLRNVNIFTEFSFRFFLQCYHILMEIHEHHHYANMNEIFMFGKYNRFSIRTYWRVCNLFPFRQKATHMKTFAICFWKRETIPAIPTIKLKPSIAIASALIFTNKMLLFLFILFIVRVCYIFAFRV